MQRTLVVGMLLLGACRMNFDPVTDEAGGDPEAIGSTQMASTITAEPGSDLAYNCRPGVPCMVDCSEAVSCLVDCGGATTCDVLCAPGGCIVQSCTAPSCEVDCGLGAKTVIDDAQFCTNE